MGYCNSCGQNDRHSPSCGTINKIGMTSGLVRNACNICHQYHNGNCAPKMNFPPKK